MRLSDKDIQCVKDDIKLVKNAWYYLLYIKCSKNNCSKLMLIKQIVKSLFSIIGFN